MARITGMTAERMLEIEAASVVDGDIVGDNLFLTRKDGSLLNAGNVRGAPGPEGPRGSNLAVITAQPVLDVGIINQIRAGRQLTVADFTNQGLNPPLALWNLSNLNDSSGNGRTLVNKGAVPSAPGINGVASTAMMPSGSTTQALYVADTGAADPLRIKMGSWGMWFKIYRRGTQQYLMSKLSSAAGNYAWEMYINNANNLGMVLSLDGSTVPVLVSFSDVCDGRWHFAVCTYDGTKGRIYIDGAQENSGNMGGGGPIFAGNAPVNLGGRAGDAATATSGPVTGLLDEGFVTADILSDENVRNLYCASIPHALGAVPASFAMSVRRKRRGGPLATTDFPAQPARLYPGGNSSLADAGSNAVALSNLSPALIVPVAGPDGLPNSAWHMSGAHLGLGSTDAGLPSGLSPRSYGLWIKTLQSTAVPGILGWGSGASSGAGAVLGLTSGVLYVQSGANSAVTGPRMDDGLWHFAVAVEDNAAADGQKIKIYVDGRLVATSTLMGSITLGGPNRFRVGNYPDSAVAFLGQTRLPFVYAGTLTPEQVRGLYAVGSQPLAPAPKAAADHIEASETARLLAIFDSIESSDSIDLAVMA
jgi:hypothetical protein